jgi:hypothetical protein
LLSGNFLCGYVISSVVMKFISSYMMRAPQLNNILQILEPCEIAIGVGQGAADLTIGKQTSAYK